MKEVVFITGNQGKADFLAKWLGHPVEHIKLDLDEIQSLDVHVISEHKARQAYAKLKRPVLVEDAYLRISALGDLPGSFIKFFIEELGLEKMCRMLDSFDDKSARAGVCFAYFDGTGEVRFFEGEKLGTITNHPRGEGGFGFDPIFVPDGQPLTFAEMGDEELSKHAIRSTLIFPALKAFLTGEN